MQLGYQLVLPLIVLAGIVQLGLSRLNVSALTKLFPPAVISGMLAAIGIIILIKQIPLLLGTTFQSYSVSGIIYELPSQLPKLNPLVMSLGLSTLLLIVVFHFLSKRFTGLKILPPFSYALFISSLVSLSLPLASKYLLQLPSDPLQSIVFLDLHLILSSGENWGKLLKAFISILLINCIDSMAILQAVDNIDPYERKSDQKRSLLGIGACNIASGMLGGITVIPEAIRSTVGILAGSRTQWANFWNAIILLIGWLALQPVLTHIPLTVLAAVLIACSFSLCKPAIWVMFWKEGKISLAVFILTIILTVKIDMLWGLVCGCTLSYVLKFIESKFAEKQ
jgi:MFS superfamily sulfate permease-like transporter